MGCLDARSHGRADACRRACRNSPACHNRLPVPPVLPTTARTPHLSLAQVPFNQKVDRRHASHLPHLLIHYLLSLDLLPTS